MAIVTGDIGAGSAPEANWSQYIGKTWITRGQDGTLHAYYTYDAGAPYVYWTHSTDSGTSWETPELIAGGGSWNFYGLGGSIDVDGRPICFGYYGEASVYGIYARRAVYTVEDDAVYPGIDPRWDSSEFLKAGSAGPIVMVDHSSGYTHFLYSNTSNSDYDGDQTLIHNYTRGRGTTWGGPTVLVQDDSRGYCLPIDRYIQFDMDIDLQGNVHVAYFADGVDCDLFYRKWDKATETWGSPETIQVGSYDDQYSAGLNVGSDGTIHVIGTYNSGEFSGYDNLHYWKKEVGGSWSSPVALTSDTTDHQRGKGPIPLANGDIIFSYQADEYLSSHCNIASYNSVDGVTLLHTIEKTGYNCGFVWNGSLQASQPQTGWMLLYGNSTDGEFDVVYDDTITWGDYPDLTEDVGEHVRRCSLTIDADEIDSGDRENFTVILSPAILPAEMLVESGEYAALEGGGDIRFSTDEAGENLIPCDIRYFSPADGRANIAVKLPEVSQTTDTTFYMWYNKAGVEQPNWTGEFGRFNAYDDYYVSVLPLCETGTGFGHDFKDRTRNEVNYRGGDGGGTHIPDSVDSPFDKGLEFGVDDDYLDSRFKDGQNYDHIQNTLEFSIEALVALDNLSPRQVILTSTGSSGEKGFIFMWDTLGSGFGDEALRLAAFKGSSGNEVIDGHSNDGSTITDANWHHVAATGIVTFNGLLFYVDGSVKSTTYGEAYDTLSTGNATNPCLIGRATSLSTTTDFEGKMAEVRVSNVNRDPGWLAAVHSNLLTPTDFITVGTPETVYVAPVSNLRRSMNNLFSC